MLETFVSAKKHGIFCNKATRVTGKRFIKLFNASVGTN